MIRASNIATKTPTKSNNTEKYIKKRGSDKKKIQVFHSSSLELPKNYQVLLLLWFAIKFNSQNIEWYGASVGSIIKILVADDSQLNVSNRLKTMRKFTNTVSMKHRTKME